MKIRTLISDLFAAIGLFAILGTLLFVSYGYGEFGVYVEDVGGYHIYIED